MKQSEKIAIIGGSISGIFAALAFASRGHDVTVIERDPLPAATMTGPESGQWRRPGAPHTQHQHLLTVRLRSLILEKYPDLLDDLVAAGVWDMPFYELLHPDVRHKFKPKPNDADIAMLMSRRTTLELVLRRYVERRPEVRFLSQTQVRSLIVKDRSIPVEICGVRVRSGSNEYEIAADVVIGAAGRTSQLRSELETYGVQVNDEVHRSNCVYHSRHYRILPGREHPKLNGFLGVSLDYMVAAGLPADNGYIVVTLATFQDDPLVSGKLGSNDLFQKICDAIPKIAPLVAPAFSEPVSDVISWANMDFLWRSTIKDGAPQVCGLFFIGDAAMRSNPKFGRGCTWGAIQAHLLAEVVSTVREPAERVLQYEAARAREFRTEWEFLLNADRSDYRKFAVAAGLQTATLTDRLKSAMQRHVVNRLIAGDPEFLRTFFQVVSGSDRPSALKRALTAPRVASALFASQTVRSVAAALTAGPSRQSLGQWISELSPDQPATT